MTIKLTASLAWIRYPSYLGFFRTIFAFSIMSLSLNACTEAISDTSQPAIDVQDNAYSPHRAGARRADSTPIIVAQNTLKAVNQAAPIYSKVSWVLDGTDLLKITDVKYSSGHSNTDWSGQYSSEQGGSLLNLHIEPNGPGQWSLSRHYSEPALKTHTKQYGLHVTDEGLISQSADIVVKKTEEGVLVFESGSDVSSIPTSYWVHYLKRQ